MKIAFGKLLHCVVLISVLAWKGCVFFARSRFIYLSMKRCFLSSMPVSAVLKQDFQGLHTKNLLDLRVIVSLIQFSEYVDITF